MTKRERLAEIFRRLTQAAPLSSANEALELLFRTINTVEDELSGIVYHPNHPGSDGRIYPPPVEYDPSTPSAYRLGSRCERITITSDGTIVVRDKATETVVLFRKPGR